MVVNPPPPKCRYRQSGCWYSAGHAPLITGLAWAKSLSQRRRSQASVGGLGFAEVLPEKVTILAETAERRKTSTWPAPRRRAARRRELHKAGPRRKSRGVPLSKRPVRHRCGLEKATARSGRELTRMNAKLSSGIWCQFPCLFAFILFFRVIRVLPFFLPAYFHNFFGSKYVTPAKIPARAGAVRPRLNPASNTT